MSKKSESKNNTVPEEASQTKLAQGEQEQTDAAGGGEATAIEVKYKIGKTETMAKDLVMGNIYYVFDKPDDTSPRTLYPAVFIKLEESGDNSKSTAVRTASTGDVSPTKQYDLTFKLIKYDKTVEFEEMSETAKFAEAVEVISKPPGKGSKKGSKKGGSKKRGKKRNSRKRRNTRR